MRRRFWPPLLLSVPAFALLICSATSLAQGGANVTPHTGILRLALPDELPAHPRVFCTADNLARIRADLAGGDAYTRTCVNHILGQAEAALARLDDLAGRRADAGDTGAAATLAQAYVLSDEARYGQACRQLLLALADVYPTLETTRSRGRLRDSTLAEGPVAVNCSMAYDLIADAPFMSGDDRRHIEQDLLRTMAWECGHKCAHCNSSNWRSWALAIVASCGFATGDRELIEEATNGVYDPERNAYLYGIVQQLTHSVFSDGIHWERSMGYTYYTASALMYAMEAAANSGIDLWHAKLPGILGPFEGSAGHEEYGPPGDRSIKAMLDAPFYFAFAGGSFARIGDSGTSSLSYHPIYELAYQEYEDPKYAWLTNRQRERRDGVVQNWTLWRARGAPEGRPTAEPCHDGSFAFRLRTNQDDRIALWQDISVPADQPVTVTGWVKAIDMDGATAHIRCNFGQETVHTGRVEEAGDWRQVRAEIPPAEGAEADSTRRIRLHVFLENGAGEVVWDDIRLTVGDADENRVRNGGFEYASIDGRELNFWSLAHSPAEVPEGHYGLAEDATIGISGRHENGCTLFPVGGFAILRADPTDPDATALNLAFGPYGSGHDHPDRLHFSLYGLGAALGPDAGSWGYDDPMHLTWANQTVAHNTLTVDEVAQQPQGTSDSIFAGERGDQRVHGVLRLFHPGNALKAVRATCDTAYPGVRMDRTLCLVDRYVLDVFRVSSADEHTYDLAFHGLGQAESDALPSPLEENPFAARGYAHLTEVRAGFPPAGPLRVVFRGAERSVLLLQLQPEAGEVILARDPTRDGARSSCIARRRGTQATYVTVFEPYQDAPTVRSIGATERAGALLAVVSRAVGADQFVLPADLGGPIRLGRYDADHRLTLEETARPEGGL